MVNPVGGLGASQASAFSVAQPGGKLGKDEFLKMLVAQMRNQDPMNPMNSDQLAVQLAQFSSVEQLMNLNKALEGQSSLLVSMAEGMNSNAALGVIGKTVTALGNGLQIEAGSQPSVRATVGGSGGTATLRVLDQNGNVVGTQSLGEVRSGEGNWKVDAQGMKLEPGWYRYEIEVKDSGGNAVPVQTFMTARVDGIQFTANGPVLKAGPYAIPFGTIAEILTK